MWTYYCQINLKLMEVREVGHGIGVSNSLDNRFDEVPKELLLRRYSCAEELYGLDSRYFGCHYSDFDIKWHRLTPDVPNIGCRLVQSFQSF